MNLDIHRFERIPSSQDVLHQMAEAGAPSGTVVVATVQEGARGQRGRPWSSPEGGLWLSVLVRPRSAAAGEVLSLRAGLAVAAVLDALGTLPPVQLKWPNDLLIDGRKVGGLLCEARWRGSELGWVVVGCGINVRNPVPEGLPQPAARLAEWDPALTPDQLLAPVATALASLEQGGERLSAEELDAFRARHWLKGRRVSGPVAGIVGQVTADGALQVGQNEGGTVHLRSASVELE
ncbi:MAG TPA: biotin--[acetyl-CoA-carboxylase] ligase [Gemmatimonadales bacterium]|nr:biotin--[acetyl-CoA-carboxylase] ligase [Gemmatimonadales bacterium]